MKEKNPLDPIFDQIADLMQQIQVKRTSPIDEAAAQDLEQQFEKIQKDVELFCQINNQIIESEGITDQDLQNTIKGSKDHLPLKERQILEKAEQLKNHIEHEKLNLELAKGIIKKLNKSDDKNKFGEKRKKKFKGVGGSKGWIPL